MTHLRRALGPVAAVWLLTQAATFVIVPAVFQAGSTAAPLQCTCVHDRDHNDCPMHHKSPAGARVCFQTTDSTGLAALGSLLGHLGLVPPPAHALTLPPAHVTIVVDPGTATLRPAPPDPPPPRA